MYDKPLPFHSHLRALLSAILYKWSSAKSEMVLPQHTQKELWIVILATVKNYSIIFASRRKEFTPKLTPSILLTSRIWFYKTLPHSPENISQSRIMERVWFFFQGRMLKGDLISKKLVLLKDCERAMFTLTHKGCLPWHSGNFMNGSCQHKPFDSEISVSVVIMHWKRQQNFETLYWKKIHLWEHNVSILEVLCLLSNTHWNIPSMSYLRVCV